MEKQNKWRIKVMERHGNGMVHRNENLQAMLHWLSIHSMATGVGN